MLDEIIAIYAITDDLLKALGHHEDSRIEMSDAEIITATCYFANIEHLPKLNFVLKIWNNGLNSCLK